MDQDNKGTLDLNKLEDELKRLNDENQYMRSAFNILRKNVISRVEKPQMELKPPDILKDDKDLVDLTKSVADVSDKLYSLETELDNLYIKMSKLTTSIVGTERYNDTESSKKNNVEATARKPRDIPDQVTYKSPQCLKLDEDLELITSTWMTMKEKERSNTTSQVVEQSKSFGTEGADVERINDIQVLKDKINGLEILMSALEEYVTSDKQNSSFVVPSDLQSDQRRVVAYDQTKRIAQKFEMMKSELSAKDQENVNLKIDYKNNFELFWTEYEELKTANTGLEGSLKAANADVTKVEGENENVKKELDQLRSECEELKTTNQALTEKMTSSNAELSAVEEEMANMKKEHEKMFGQLWSECEELKITNQALTEKMTSANAYKTLWAENQKLKRDKTTLSECLKQSEAHGLWVEKKNENTRKEYEKRLDQLRSECEELETTNEALTEKMTSAIANLTAAIEEKEKMKEYEKKYKTLWPEYQKLKSDKTILSESLEKSEAYGLEVKKKIEIMRKEYEKSYKLLWDKYEKQKTDLENTHRLSKLIGDHITHDIANLSDAVRPTKLSECFSEIYDTEWTDAFTELTEDSCLSDDNAIRRLLDILMNAFRKCKEITWDRYETLNLIASTLHVKDENAASSIIKDSQETMKLETTHLNSTLSIDEKTSLKDIWRSSTVSLRKESLSLIYALLSTRLCTPETNLPKTYKYLKVCCDLCWKMFMQEKPMHLEINAEKQIGQENLFDTERFRAYTKAGKCVAYVVWPALFLHEGGPMLAKGIAQGCNKVPNN